MSQEGEDQTERLDHVGIVAGVCQEAGRAEWLEKQAGERRRSVSVGKATVAMVRNGLGFSNRQRYLVPQDVENTPVEHVVGEGITAERLNDDGVGRPLDWLSEHDVTTLFAGLARPRPSSLWHCRPTCAYRYNLVLSQWRRGQQRGGGSRAGSDHVWLFPRAPRGSQTRDARPGHHP